MLNRKALRNGAITNQLKINLIMLSIMHGPALW